MYDASDILLYVISAKREVSWTEYKKIYDYLYTTHVLPKELDETNVNFKRSQTARALDALGHCDLEFSKDVQKVFSAPPVLVRLPRAGLPTAMLVGTRFPRTVIRLKDVAKTKGRRIKVILNKQPGGYVLEPLRVVVEAEYASDIAEVGELLGFKFENHPPAWSVMNFSASLDQYMTTCSWSQRGDLNWPRKDFSFNLLSYTRNQQPDRAVRLSRYVDPVRNINLHLLWKGDQCTEIDGDWGRYAALREAGINILRYDSRQFAFGVPSTVPLPRLIARGLSLCSGYLPRIVDSSEPTLFNRNHSAITVYNDVPPPIAQLAATKLGQSLASCSLDSKLGGDGS